MSEWNNNIINRQKSLLVMSKVYIIRYLKNLQVNQANLLAETNVTIKQCELDFNFIHLTAITYQCICKKTM